MSIARKEVRHVLRDPFTLALALGLPVLLVTFFGFAIDFDVKDIRLSVYDRDRTPASRGLAEAFSASGYFKLRPGAHPESVPRDLDAEEASAVLVIEPEFSKRIGLDRAQAQLLLDGADNTSAGTVLGYLAGIQSAAQKKLAPAPPPGGDRAGSMILKTRFLFNPELNTRWFTVPGLAVIVVGLLSIMLTALTVAREWENGSMELLLSTPVKPAEIVLGKLSPYVALVLAALLIVYLVARLLFRMPFAGSHPLFFGSSLLFLLACLSQGLLISVAVRQQQIAMQLSIVTGLLPSMLLSGFIFPVESMPAFFRYFTMILPPRWFLEVARGLFLKAMNVLELAGPLLALLLMDALLIAAATRRFKADLEP
ncbi:MAG: ABC transporter permease [Elusimicrobia bacterium]|nr:ABC transporter permease [Elusimicrobiota bacterium]